MDIQIQVLASSSSGNCYAVTDGATPLLLECGIRFKDIQAGTGHRVTSMAGCLVSHEHGDHAKAVSDVARAGVDVYASQGTIDALGVTHHRLRPIRAHHKFQLGSWTVLPFDIIHDAAEPLGFLLVSEAGKVLYLTDTAYCPYRFNGLTHLLIEANYSLDIIRQNVAAGSIPLSHKNRVIRSHMSIERVLDMLRANDLSRVREIWLLHMSAQSGDEAAFRRRVQEATGKPTFVAQEGLR